MPGRPSLDRRGFIQAAGTLGLLQGIAESGAAKQPERRNELLVGVSPSTASVQQTVARAIPAEARVVSENSRLGYATVELPARTSTSAQSAVATAVARRSGIEYVEQNKTHRALYTPNDPLFEDQYAPQMVNAPVAWDTTPGEREVTIAVVDTGVQYDHPDLQGNFGSNKGRDFVDNDSDPSPDVPNKEYHATHVAGIVAAETDNNRGIAGISNGTLLGVRTLNESGTGYTSDIADGIQWATDQGADIINLSLGGGGYTETMQKAVSYAYGEGVLLVAAAGNDYGGPVDYPAAYDECIAVSALNSNGDLATYSNVGPEVELCAPGSGVLSTTTEVRGSYERINGTSMSTPLVSGVAALVLSQQDLSNEELRSRLTSTATDVGLSSDEQGAGRIDAALAVSSDGQHSNVLTIEGTPEATYTVSTTGDIEKSTANDGSINDSDTITGTTATGEVDGGVDSYAFAGDIVALAVEGSAAVYADGERIDPDQYPDHVLTIEGTPEATYTVSTTGDIEKNTANGASINGSDTVARTTATGEVRGGRDSYAFSGEIAAFQTDGNLAVYLDGQQIDPAPYLNRLVTIESTDSRATYDLTVDRKLEPTTAGGASINDGDVVSKTTAAGEVDGGADSYAFSFDIEFLRVDGDATVYVDGRSVDPGEFAGQVVTIESAGSRATYDLTVGGSLEKSTANGASINDGDEISGSSATGEVYGGADSYVFSGSVTRLDIDERARFELDRSERTITIVGEGRTVEYGFSVSGSVNPIRVNDHDTVRSRSAEGRVGTGRDVYRYTGSLRTVTIGRTTVSVDR